MKAAIRGGLIGALIGYLIMVFVLGSFYPPDAGARGSMASSAVVTAYIFAAVNALFSSRP